MKLPLEIFDGNGRIEILDADGLPIAHIYSRGRSGGKNYMADGKANAVAIIDAVNNAKDSAHGLPASIQEALNSGDGSYHP